MEQPADTQDTATRHFDRHRWMEYPTAGMLAEALAHRIAGALQGAVEANGRASLAVSGGSTPKRLFAELARQEIDWPRVTVTLVDERFVPPADARSNQKLVTEALLQGPAASARFLPLWSDAGNVDEAAQAAARRLADLPLPLDVCVLGMGGDGHTASFFGDAPNLPELLENRAGRLVLPVVAPSAGEPRLTLSLQTICAARLLALHIEGASKRPVLAAALELPIAEAPPIRAVFERSGEPVHVFWAP